MDKLPRLELTLGTEFNECSIASAELARRAEALFANPDNVVGRQMVIVDSPEAGLQRVQTVPVSSTFITAQGRTTQLLLSRPEFYPEDHIRLLAVARGDIAFPLAAFARRRGSQCDYVQIGPEMTDESLVVTTSDEYSRQDIVEAMRQLLGSNPMPYIYEKEISEARKRFHDRYSSTSAEVDLLKHEARWRLMNNSASQEKKRREKVDYTSVESELIAFLEVCQKLEVNTKIMARNSLRHYSQAKEKLVKFLNYPNMREIAAGTLPAITNPVARCLLVKQTLSSLGLWYGEEQKDTASEFSALIGLDQQINQRLGPPSIHIENVVSLVGRLASAGELTATQKNMPISSTHGDVDLFVKVSSTGNTTYAVNVRARPSAMSDFAPTDVYDLKLDRSAKVEIKDDEAEELAYILGKVAVG